MKVPILNHLESLRDEELEESLENRRQQLANRESKGKEEKENK